MRGRDRFALIVVAIALAFATLAIGGVPRWAACITAALGIASSMPYLTSRRVASQPPKLIALIVVALGLILLQLLPLPELIARQIASNKLELVRENASALGDPEPRWVVASYDPPATLVELAKMVGYLALAYTCTRLATVRRARVAMAGVVVGTGSLVALVALVHDALGLHALYGIYHPEVAPALLGPLLSPNHLASLLTLCVPLALALAVAQPGTMRAVWLAAATLLAGTGMLTGSRGGVIGLIAGVVVTVVVLIVQRRGGSNDETRRVSMSVVAPSIVVAVCTMILLTILTAGDVAHDLRSTSVDEVHQTGSKFQLWVNAEDLAVQNRWLGIGRGAFEPAYTAYADTGAATYTHVENGYLELVIDFGLPGTLLLLMAFAAASREGLKRWRHGPIEAGALGALAALAIHDLADFSIEVPGVAMTAVVVASILFPARLGTPLDDKGKRKAVDTDTIGLRLGATAIALIVVTLAASPLGRLARGDTDAISSNGDPAERLAAAHHALDRHPSDYVAAGMAASALFDQRDPRAVKVVSRALAMNPNHSGLHHLAAQMLAMSQRPEQSAVEFAAAARWARDPAPVVEDMLTVFHTPDEIARALPAEPAQAWRILHALGDRKEAAAAYAARVASANPRDPEMQALLAFTSLAAGHAADAVVAARSAWTLQPTARTANLLGQALGMSGDRAGAIALLHDAAAKTATSPTADRVALLLTMADLQEQSGDYPGAASTLDGADRISDLRQDLRITIHLKAADVQDHMGNPNQAQWERNQAQNLSPN